MFSKAGHIERSQRLAEAFVREVKKGNDALAGVYLAKYRTLLYQLTKPSSDKVHVVMMTSILDGTKGDISAASKIMAEMLSEIPSVKLTWVVRRDASDKSAAKFCPPGVELIEVVSKYGTVEKNLPFAHGYYEFRMLNHSGGGKALAAFVNANVIISCPTTIFLSRENIQLIKKLNVPFVSIPQYDFKYNDIADLLTGSRNLGKLFYRFGMGFGKGNYGVLIHQNVKDVDFQSLHQDDIDSDLFDLLYDSTEYRKDALSAKNHEASYLASTRLHFGYVNTAREGSVAFSNTVDAVNFAYACIRDDLNKAEPNKPIDIVLPVPLKKFNELVSKLKRSLPSEKREMLHSIEYHAKQKGAGEQLEFGSSAQKTVSINSKGKVRVRVLNAFPVNHRTMLSMMANAEPPLCFTGNQSFIEGVLSGKPIFYQKMFWESGFFQAFTDVVRKHFGEKSALYRFYTAQDAQSWFRGANPSYWREAMGIYERHRKAIDRDSQVLAKIIRKEYNLSQNLIQGKLKNLVESRRINQMIFNNAMAKLFADYMNEARETATFEKAVQSVLTGVVFLKPEDILNDSKSKKAFWGYYKVACEKLGIPYQKSILARIWFGMIHFFHKLLVGFAKWFGYRETLDYSNTLKHTLSQRMTLDGVGMKLWAICQERNSFIVDSAQNSLEPSVDSFEDAGASIPTLGATRHSVAETAPPASETQHPTMETPGSCIVDMDDEALYLSMEVAPPIGKNSSQEEKNSSSNSDEPAKRELPLPIGYSPSVFGTTRKRRMVTEAIQYGNKKECTAPVLIMSPAS